MSKEAMKLALEALKEIVAQTEGRYFCMKHDHVALQNARFAIARLREALANEALDKMSENARELGLDYEPAQQEPVAWMFPDDLKRFETSEAYAEAYSIKMGSPTQGETVPLYTSPPAQRTWVGLTDEEVKNLCLSVGAEPIEVRLIEAKLRERNT